MTNGAPPRRWRFNWSSLVAATIAVVGLFVLMYPSTAAWLSSYEQSKVIRDYTAGAKVDPPPGNVARLKEAREYNAALTAGEIVVGADKNKPTADGSSTAEGALEYEELLNGTEGMMARIKVPSIDVDLPVYHGTSDATLDKGVGHLEGTSLPVGGVDTHSALTAHRGLASATMFNDLNKLKAGDTFTIEVMGDVLTYQVYETQVVDPSDTKKVALQPGKDIVTLVTCTPLGINSHRILVTGERITPTPEADIAAAGKAPEVPGFPWWAVILPAGLAVGGFFIWRSGYPPKPRAKKVPA